MLYISAHYMTAAIQPGLLFWLCKLGTEKQDLILSFLHKEANSSPIITHTPQEKKPQHVLKAYLQ